MKSSRGGSGMKSRRTSEENAYSRGAWGFGCTYVCGTYVRVHLSFYLSRLAMASRVCLARSRRRRRRRAHVWSTGSISNSTWAASKPPRWAGSPASFVCVAGCTTAYTTTGLSAARQPPADFQNTFSWLPPHPTPPSSYPQLARRVLSTSFFFGCWW